MPSLYSLDQLMEHAGLCAALAAADAFPLPAHSNVLICAGPGNNGGDGLVAARHLRSLGYAPSILCPKPPASAHCARCLQQCRALGIPVFASLEDAPPLRSFHCALDAILGFSSALPLRAPFAALVEALQASGLPALSVDVPTGWAVDSDAAPPQGALQPCALLSLTAPKPCAAAFARHGAGSRRHYLGLAGIVPPDMAARYGLDPSPPPPTPGLGGLVRLQ